MLIAASELNARLNDRGWLVFDCRHDLFDFSRGANLYAEGHVPGAVFAPVETVLSGPKSGTNGRHPLPSADEFAAFLNHHGATPATTLVAYDDVGNQYAARLWWLARWIGLTRVHVLDGGWAAWLARGYPVARDSVVPTGGGTIVARPGAMPVASADDVLHSMETRRGLVLDARAPERFRGEKEPIDRVAGRIPSARNRFFKENLNPDLTLRDATELQRDFAALLDGTAPHDVIHHCGSGVTACVNLLAMEQAGFPGSKLYVGSWSEWIADPSRQIARG